MSSNYRLLNKKEDVMNDKVKAGMALSGIAAIGYGIGRGIEFFSKKVIKKVKDRKAEEAVKKVTEK